jgi:hypothetical protein
MQSCHKERGLTQKDPAPEGKITVLSLQYKELSVQLHARSSTVHVRHRLSL